MSATKFNKPSRQSAKGIIVIFGYSIYKIIRATIIIIAAFFIKYFQNNSDLNPFSLKIVLPFFGFLLLFLAMAILKYRNFIFYVSDSNFILKKGIVNKEEVSVAKSKIQNVYIKQNLLQQVINVVSLSIETAGDDKTEIEIKALSKPDAFALKKLLLDGAKQSLYANSEIKTKKDIQPIFFKPSMKSLFLEGISENHFKSFIIIFAFLMTTYNDAKDAISQLKISSKFNKYFELDSESLASIFIFNIVIVFVLIIISFIFSLVKTVIQNFDLTVLKKEDGFEISKGLFNKTSLSLKTSRIQTATIVTNRFKIALGLFQMKFTQAMVNKKQKQKFNIIGLNKTKVNALIDTIFPSALQNHIKNKPNKYMIYKVLFVAIVPLLLLNIGFIFLDQWLYLINIPLILIIFVAAIYKYKKAYYFIDDTYVVIGSGGFIDTTTSFSEIHKTQGVTISQSVFQKRRDLATLKIYTASNSLKIAHIDKNSALAIKNYLLFKVEHEDRDWM